MGVGRQLRRFFYAGLIGAMLAVLGQLLNSLQNVNQWLVFGLIGLLVISGAVLIERNMEAIKTWRDEVVETWE
jgi:FtsH-binding integral membrane protein